VDAAEQAFGEGGAVGRLRLSARRTLLAIGLSALLILGGLFAGYRYFYSLREDLTQISELLHDGSDLQRTLGEQVRLAARASNLSGKSTSDQPAQTPAAAGETNTTVSAPLELLSEEVSEQVWTGPEREALALVAEADQALRQERYPRRAIDLLEQARALLYGASSRLLEAINRDLIALRRMERFNQAAASGRIIHMKSLVLRLHAAAGQAGELAYSAVSSRRILQTRLLELQESFSQRAWKQALDEGYGLRAFFHDAYGDAEAVQNQEFAVELDDLIEELTVMAGNRLESAGLATVAPLQSQPVGGE
jgi:hypothetical protein